jgi:signal transduction histidine kinase
MMPTEARLSEVLREFARTMVTDFPVQAILDHLVERIVHVLPIDAAGVTLVSPAARPFVAASDASALRFETLQSHLAQGPCLTALGADGPVSVPDLSGDERFPLFAEQAGAEGLAAVFAFPLRNGARGLGALGLYRMGVGVLEEREMAAAQTLADVVSAYVANAQARCELQAAAEAEREALARLRRLDEAKTEFVETVMHELRTPMTSISGYTELLHDEEAGHLTPTQMGFVDAIGRNSSRLATLANDLLTLSSLEPGTIRHDPVKMDLREVVSAAEEALEAVIEARELTVRFEVPGSPVPVFGDGRQLERMLTNLMTNALKFTDDGGLVCCTLCLVAGHARLTVEDTGIGIPEAEQHDLFTKFFRSSSAEEHHVPGSGLCLTIVESIVRSHGGRISVVSAHARGTTVTIDLPLGGRRTIASPRGHD